MYILAFFFLLVFDNVLTVTGGISMCCNTCINHITHRCKVQLNRIFRNVLRNLVRYVLGELYILNTGHVE
jgi:hypothetical protein